MGRGRRWDRRASIDNGLRNISGVGRDEMSWGRGGDGDTGEGRCM